jgi:hypothetical protein
LAKFLERTFRNIWNFSPRRATTFMLAQLVCARGHPKLVIWGLDAEPGSLCHCYHCATAQEAGGRSWNTATGKPHVSWTVLARRKAAKKRRQVVTTLLVPLKF